MKSMTIPLEDVPTAVVIYPDGFEKTGDPADNGYWAFPSGESKFRRNHWMG